MLNHPFMLYDFYHIKQQFYLNNMIQWVINSASGIVSALWKSWNG